MEKLKKTYSITAKGNGVMFPEEFYVPKSLSEAKKMFSVMTMLYPYRNRQIIVYEITTDEQTNEKSLRKIMTYNPKDESK